MGFKRLNAQEYRASGARSQPSITINKTGLLKFSKAFFEKYGMLEHGKDYTKSKMALDLVFDEKSLMVGVVFIKNAQHDAENGYFHLYSHR